MVSIQLLRRGDVVSDAEVTVTKNLIQINTTSLMKYGYYSLAIQVTHNSE